MNGANSQLWDYAESENLLPKLDGCPRGNGTRPPVFQKRYAELNILVPPDTDAKTRATIIATLPQRERHRWFHSMKSSQALAQSVFANLIVSNHLDALNNLASEQDGLPAFGIDLSNANVRLEHEISHLGEPRPTSIDVFISNARRIAVECKFTELEFGKCSRPNLVRGKDVNYEHDFCDGSYTQQRGRTARCSLSERGIRYWQYVPELFSWKNNRDLAPCPLRSTYQIVRNLLAACVTKDGAIDTETAHALIIYDTRNPAFHSRGKSRIQFDAARTALKHPSLLRSCSWQAMVSHLRKTDSARWLVTQLQNKYGF